MKKTYKLILPAMMITLMSVSFGHSFSEVYATSINVTDTSESSIRSYYSSLNSLAASERQGTNLLENLKPILSSGHTVISYDGTTGTWAWFKITDRDWTLSPLTSGELASYTVNYDASYDDPYVHLLYRNDNGTATAAKYSDTHGTYIDREHVWPQSHGFKATSGATGPAGTDLHHLMLGDSANNQQGHNNYDWGEPTSNITVYGSAANHNNTGKNGTLTYGGVTGTVYEPQDSDKGDIARACFYMVARYASYTSTFDPYLTLLDGISGTATQSSSASTPATLGILNTLLEWNALDPVDDYEVHRNNLIYNNVQHNRNPFIDYPGWVDAVFGSATASPATDDVRLYGETSTAPTALTVHPTSDTLTVGSNSTLTVTPTPSSASSSVTWSSNNEAVATVSGGVVTAVAAGSATITATSTLDTNVKATCAITVSEVPVVTLSSITLSGSTSTATLGSAYSTSGITVTAHYSDASSADVTSSAVINTPSSDVLGTQSVRVSYTEGDLTKNAYYSVKVTNQGASVGIATPVLASDLIISEYIEGTSYNKAIEIFNGTGASVSLSDYKLRVNTNGAISTTNISLGTGTLAYNDSFVISHGSANAAILAVADLTSGSISFNGNDAVSLFKVSAGINIDVIGIIGNDPTTAWTGTAANAVSGSTADKTLVRTSSTISPSTTFAWGEWNAFATDTFSYIGTHTMDTSSLAYDVTPTEQANAFVSYVLDGIGATAEGSCGSVFTELKTEHDYMVSDAKTLFATSTDELFVSARERYNYIATYTGNSGSVISGLSSLPLTNENADLMGIILIAIVGLTGVLVYSSARRKEE